MRIGYARVSTDLDYSQRLQTYKDSIVRSDFRRWRCGCALYRRVALGRQAVSVRHWASPSRVAGSWIVAIIILAIGRRSLVDRVVITRWESVIALFKYADPRQYAGIFEVAPEYESPS
jgi:hypothetical protein